MNSVPPFSTVAFPASTRSPENHGCDGDEAIHVVRSRTAAQVKSTDLWQDGLWRRWPKEECWPGKMYVYEAAAYLRVSPDTIRRGVETGRDGKAELAQRIRGIYRIRKTDLDTFGSVSGR